MLGDIRNDVHTAYEEFEMILCKPNMEEIAVLQDAFNIKLNLKFNDVNELEFDLPYYTQYQYKQFKNPNWDLVKGDYLIKVNNEIVFIIKNTKENGEERDIKHVKCYSLEYSLGKRHLRLFQGTRQLYKDNPETGEGIFNLLEEQTQWKCGYIDEKARKDNSLGQHHNKYRTFNVTEKSWLSFLKEEISPAFECVFFYDTINKKVNIYDYESYGVNKGLYISKENYIKTFEKEIKQDEVVTRLYIYGKDNISISKVNPTGKEYIEDFSYYKNTDYMPQSLIDSLNKYEELSKNKSNEFHLLLLKKSELEQKKDKQNEIIINLKNELYSITCDLGLKIRIGEGESDEYKQLMLHKHLKDIEITNAENALKNIENDIKNVISDIVKLGNLLEKTNNFTKEELNILDNLTFEKNYHNANFSEEDELYKQAWQEIKKINEPPVQFEIDIIDFLNVIECQHDWSKLSIGDFINVEYNKFGIEAEVRLTGIIHEIDNNKLKLQFTNKKMFETSSKYLSDLIGISKDTGRTLSVFKHQWDLSLGNRDLITNIIESSLDTSKNKILSCNRNQDISIDEHGIHMKYIGDTNRQLWMLNDIIAFTNDGWETASLAITPEGIVGQEIYGKVIGSNRLVITNEKGTFEVKGDCMKAENMYLQLTGNENKNRILLDPNLGIKIMRNESGTWKDALWLDNDGKVNAESFKIINKNTILDDNGLKIDNGAIKIYNRNGKLIFDAGNEGQVDAAGRFRVLKDLTQGISAGNVLVDIYKDEPKGGKIIVNDWQGKANVFLGSAPDESFNGGFLNLYNNEGKERITLGILKNMNSGSLILKGKNDKERILLSGEDENNVGIISLHDEAGVPKLILRGMSKSDNVSSGVNTGGYIEIGDNRNSRKCFITFNGGGNFGVYDNDRNAFEINYHMNSVILSHKAKEFVTLSDDSITIGFGDGNGYDYNKPYISVKNSEIILSFNTSNKIVISNNGVSINGNRINLN